jgi:sugar lactone lactonase YvrE
MSLRCVVPIGDKCGEAATWDEREAVLYWCDVNRFLIHRMARDGGVRSWFFDEPVTALSMTERDGVLLVALGSRLLLWTPATDARDDWGFALGDHPGVRLNDGRAAPNGDVWIGSMANNVGPNGEPGDVVGRKGVLMRFQGRPEPSVFKRDIGISNTVCWSPDQRTFYFGDTPQNTIWAYDYDAVSGDISNERVFFSGFDQGVPDGSAVDAEGFLWNCRFDGRCVVRVAPDGVVDRVVEMPVRNITTCAFGGPGFATLFITTAGMMTTPDDRLAGSLFALDAGVSGLPGFRAKV